MLQLAISFGIVTASALVVWIILGFFLKKDFSSIELATKENKERKKEKAK